MLNVHIFAEQLRQCGIDFYTGVPDSLLADFCAFLEEAVPPERHVIAAHEGGAVALAAGHFLSSGRPALVYMQNSGLGNAVNPLVSLMDAHVYGIPALLMIGWRGEPGTPDEPQHMKQGAITRGMLSLLGIPCTILGPETEDAELPEVLKSARDVLFRGGVYALLLRRKTFYPYTRNRGSDDLSDMTREEAIAVVAQHIGERGVLVATTGKISRELFAFREKAGASHHRDFLTIGSMGHCSQIAVGIALARPRQKVYCLDGDGAFIMHAGGVLIAGGLPVPNFTHIVLNNAVHDSVGGQPTVGGTVSLPGIADAAGYKAVNTVDRKESLRSALQTLDQQDGPSFLEIRVRRGSSPDLSRPSIAPDVQKRAFMHVIGDDGR